MSSLAQPRPTVSPLTGRSSLFVTAASADYPKMFEAYLALLPAFKQEVTDNIAWAKRVLKKDNRIIWWLRWVRLGLVQKSTKWLEPGAVNGADPKQVHAQLTAMYSKLVAEAQNKAGGENVQTAMALWATYEEGTKEDLEHFYALDDPAIQNFDPGYKTPNEVIEELRQLERKYVARTEVSEGTVVPKQEDTIFLRVDANWAWWLLPRASCRDEAQAMGHCGNSPDAKRDDMSILSLREKKRTNKGKDRWEPHCTFILHRIGKDVDKGTLGEMKGKGNAKPVARYHPAIIKLLEDPRIVGIDGGGYKPENNFSPKDLTPEQRAKIEAVNPASLMSLKDYYHDNGLDDVCAARVAARIGVKNEQCYDGFVVESWKDMDAFVEACGDSDVKQLQAYLEDGVMMIFDDHFLTGVEDDDPVFEGLAEYIKALDPNFVVPSENLAEAVRKYIQDTTIDDADSPLRKGLEEAFLAGLVDHHKGWSWDKDTLQSLLWAGIDNSTEDSHTSITYEGSEVIQYIPEEEALHLAFESRSGGGNYDSPSIYVDLDISQSVALAKLYQTFAPGQFTQKSLEEQGQNRLFKRPESDAEAQRDGIKHASKLAAVLMDNPAFESWFAGSKVVNADGTPKRVFHGTMKDFDTFKTPAYFSEAPNEAGGYARFDNTFMAEKSRRQYRMTGLPAGWKVGDTLSFETEYTGIPEDFDGPDGQLFAVDTDALCIRLNGKLHWIEGFHHNPGTYDKGTTIEAGDSESIKERKADTEEWINERWGGGKSGHVMPCYLSIKNPIELDWQAGNRFTDGRWGAETEDKSREMMQKYIAEGYDGIKTISDSAVMMAAMGESIGEVEVWVAFHPNQIKSAIGNTGEFNAESMSIIAALNYEEFFKTLLDVVPSYKKYVDGEIEWAKQTLKKSNRIVWWLRWVRLALVICAIEGERNFGSPPEASPDGKAILMKYRIKLIGEARSKGMEGHEAPGINDLWRFHRTFDHLYGLPVPAIQQLDPGGMDVPIVITKMQEIEEAWIEEVKGTLTPQDEDHLFLPEFPGGWGWWFLPRASCEDEAEAMGHCGNSPERGDPDRAILSLRQKKMVGGEERWQPHCTFILHTDEGDGRFDSGTLGEMKGKGNAKPVARYFPAIMKLLEDKRIKGIIGGGYEPTHNFSFDDLTEKQRQAVQAANPDAYFSFRDYVERGKPSIEVLAKRMGLEDESLTLRGGLEVYAIETWSDRDDFISSQHEPEATAMWKCIQGDMTYFVDNLFDGMDDDPELFGKIARQVNIDFAEKIDPDAPDVKDQVSLVLRHSNDDGESYLRKGLERALLVAYGWDAKDTLAQAMDILIKDSPDSDGEGYTGKIAIQDSTGSQAEYRYNIPEIVYYVPATDIPALALNYFDENEDKPRFAPTYMHGINTEDGMYNEKGALDALHEAFATPVEDKEALEAAGQHRLFKRPETDAEAEREGIKVSKLGQIAAVNYEEFFKTLLALAPEVKSGVDDNIAWAKRVLKKQNRIVWWLRWVRYAYIARAAASTGPRQEEQRAYADKLKREMEAKGVTPGPIAHNTTFIRNTQPSLEHMYSLPIPAIQDLDPGFAAPSDVIQEMEKLEQVWMEQAKGTLDPKEEDSVFVDCGGGWAWWLLPRAGCSDEAAAMGHCGNMPQSSRDDRVILSLREKKMVGKKERWEPHCTFILHLTYAGQYAGLLGEMKGKNNAKPVPRYHPMIVKLLKDRHIQGISGGGYLPSHNFAFSDLTPEQQAEVRKANPEAVFTFMESLERKGIDLDECAEKLGLYKNRRIDFSSNEGPGFVIYHWGDRYAFLHDCDNEGGWREVDACISGDMKLFSSALLQKIDPDPILFKHIANKINEEFDTDIDPEGADVVKQVCAEVANMEDDGDSFLRKGLEPALLKLYDYTPTTLSTLLTNEIDYSGEHLDHPSGKVQVVDDEDVYYYVPARTVVEIATDEKLLERLKEDGEEDGKINWEWPSVGSGFARDDEEPTEADEAATMLSEYFGAPYTRRQLEAIGQGRLFTRPGDLEHAQREGIHVGALEPTMKTAYISMKEAELTVIMDLGNQPRATITLDLGIPNFTVFSIRIPIDGFPVEEVVGYVESAFEALLDDVAAFMLTMKYPEDQVVSIEEEARKCFHAINIKDASDAKMKDKDDFIRMYEGHFIISPEFVEETQGKVVTATVVRRQPPVRRLELQRMDPNLKNNNPARIIQLYRNRSLRSQPRPHYVLVYDQRGRGVGAVPINRAFSSRLLNR